MNARLPIMMCLLGAQLACDKNAVSKADIAPVPEKPLTYTSSTAVGPEVDFSGEVQEGIIKPNQAVSSSLQAAGVLGSDIDAIVSSLRPYFDWRHARPGHRFAFTTKSGGEIVWFRYEVSPLSVLHAYRDQTGKMIGMEEKVHVRTSTVYVQGKIEHSLYMAMDTAKERPQLTLAFVDLFAWDIDFFTETKKKDEFRLIVEKQAVDGKFVRYGKIVAAEYKMASGQVHQAFFYQGEKEVRGYYGADGSSVKKAFLKSPIQFASITSRFGMRRHPVLKYKRAHRGVDYGAPRGTAIWAIGDGVVRKAGRGGGYGNVVYIRHANGFETRYAHLKAFGRGIKAGRRVSQKQIIGYVGSTGLATGPHLHFETLKHGRHVNPLRVTVPPAPPIPKEQLTRYKVSIAPWVKALTEGGLTN